MIHRDYICQLCRCPMDCDAPPFGRTKDVPISARDLCPHGQPYIHSFARDFESGVNFRSGVPSHRALRANTHPVLSCPGCWRVHKALESLARENLFFTHPLEQIAYKLKRVIELFFLPNYSLVYYYLLVLYSLTIT